METSTSAAAPSPSLAELEALGLCMVRDVAAITRIERRAAEAAANWLPAADAAPASLEEATQIGVGVDAANEALAKANPRVTALTQCYERLARAIRRTVALDKRLEAGWPMLRSNADNRHALLLRQAVRTTREKIRTRTNGDAEAAERLFDDLAARLDDPDFEHGLLNRSLDDIVDLLCQAIGLIPNNEPRRNLAAIAGFGKGPSPQLGRDPKK